MAQMNFWHDTTVSIYSFSLRWLTPSIYLTWTTAVAATDTTATGAVGTPRWPRSLIFRETRRFLMIIFEITKFLLFRWRNTFRSRSGRHAFIGTSLLLFNSHFPFGFYVSLLWLRRLLLPSLLHCDKFLSSEDILRVIFFTILNATSLFATFLSRLIFHQARHQQAAFLWEIRAFYVILLGFFFLVTPSHLFRFTSFRRAIPNHLQFCWHSLNDWPIDPRPSNLLFFPTKWIWKISAQLQTNTLPFFKEDLC